MQRHAHTASPTEKYRGMLTLFHRQKSTCMLTLHSSFVAPPLPPLLQATYSEALPAIAMAWTRAQHAGGCSPEEVHALQIGAVRCALDLTELELQALVWVWTGAGEGRPRCEQTFVGVGDPVCLLFDGDKHAGLAICPEAARTSVTYTIVFDDCPKPDTKAFFIC
eukprot:scaffold131257_cov24-Tisochrysis_lutea.AAC.1